MPVLTGLVLVLIAVVMIGMAVITPPRAATGGSGDPGPVPTLGRSLRVERWDGPPRTAVLDPAGAVLVVLTDGSRTVALAGPRRTFAEPGATAAVVDSATWVRFVPQPWVAGADRSTWFRPWLDAALVDRSPDVLAVALEYLGTAPDRFDDTGLRIAGDASFGPLRDDAKRAEASDFYDYLGVSWSFSDGVREEPASSRRGAVDCSGFLRLVVGYRMGFPLLGGNDPGPGLPRRAYAMAEHGPGTEILPDDGVPPADLGRLQPGDLLFFVTDDMPGIDHSALYLGIDSDGRRRFVSSRSSLDGPTVGDGTAASVVDGEGWFASRFRAARRL